MQIVLFLSVIAGMIILYSCQEAPTEVASGSTAATIVGTVTFNNQALPGIKVVDANSANQTAYFTDTTGTFTISLKLTAQYTASLIITDPALVYNNDTVSVTLNPGDTKTLPTIVLTKKPKVTTTISGVVSFGAQLLPGMKVVDVNSATPAVYYTDSTGSFTVTLKLISQYTANLVISDPAANFNPDTVSVTLIPGDNQILPMITLTKKIKISTTVSGTVSSGGQALIGVKVSDINSLSPTIYTTDLTGSFTIPFQLTAQYTASLVVWDLASVYNPDTVKVTINPGDIKTLPLIVLTKSTTPKTLTTVSGSVNFAGQLLQGLKVVDINSANPVAYSTDSSGSFTIPFKLSSQYTADIIVSDPLSVYNADTILVTLNPGDVKVLSMITLVKKPRITATVTGSVSFGGQLLPNMKVVDINSASQTPYFTDQFGNYTVPFQLISQYTAALVISDPSTVYSPDTVKITLSPGDAKVIPLVVLTKNVYPKLTTTITGAVSCGGLLLSGMKIVDINSSSPTTYTTDSSGGFLITLKLTSQYTADLVISDPNAVYNNDTVTVTVNPSDAKILPMITLTKMPKITATITGSVSFGGQLLSSIQVVDINSTGQTIYTTNASGSFTIPLQLTAQYTASLVLSDPSLTYNNDTITVIVNPGDTKILSIIVLTKRPKIATTISGTVSSGGQFLSGMKVVDINSTSQTVYTTDSYGGFSIQLKLSSQYSTSLVISDPNLVYNNDTVAVTVNPGDSKVFPNIILTKSSKITTTITGTVSYNGQLLSGINIVDINSISKTVNTTNALGSFTYTLQLSSTYTVRLLVSDPTSVYNNDTLTVTVNPGDKRTLSLITLSRNPKVTTTITGTVSYGGQLISGLQVFDLTSLSQIPIAITNEYGFFIDTLQLSSQYTAHLVISDPSSVYNNDTIAVTVNPGDAKVLPLLILTKNPKVTTTITGSVSYNGQLLSGINVVDINSANQTTYTTDAFGSFTYTNQLASLYMARLVFSDLMAVYNPDTVTVTLNPGDKKVLPLIILTKNTSPRLATTITGTVNFGGQLLAGMKIVDINSTVQTSYTTDATGSFTLAYQLTSPYTARLVISDPNSVYNNDTVSVTMNAGDTKTLAAITLARSPNITTTISGTVSYNGQLLPNMKVVDINSAIQTVYTTDVNGSFTVTTKLISSYTANLVISDPNNVYNNDSVVVTVNPGDAKTLSMISLTKNTSPKVITTISGTVSYNGQLLSGIKVVDMNSANPVASYTDASGSFLISLQLSAQYTARLVVTDPLATYNPDTSGSILLNPGDVKSIAITLTKNSSAIRTANQVTVVSMSANHIFSKGVGVLEGNAQLENCKYVLQVKDSSGVAIAGSPSYKATFSLKFYPADGAYGTPPSANPDSESTDENGQLPVTVASGTCPGTVQLIVQIALANGASFTTYITRLDIYSGFADQSHFNVATASSEGGYPNGFVVPYWGVYQTHNYIATVADTFGYAVPSGHAVGFISTPGGDGIIGNNGISVTDANGSAGVAWISWPPTPSQDGYFTTSDPATSGRRGYTWLQAQTMGKNGKYIRDSLLVLWNEGFIHDSLASNSITMTSHTHSPVNTLFLWDSNLNPINATVNATVDLGTNPPLGESFAVEGDFGSDPITIPEGDYRLLGRGNTFFVFGIVDQSSIATTGMAVTIKIHINSQNYAPVTINVPVIVN